MKEKISATIGGGEQRVNRCERWIKIINQEIAVVASSRPQEIGKKQKQVKTNRRRRLDDSHHFENKSKKHPEGRDTMQDSARASREFGSVAASVVSIPRFSRV
jgi:hypothetical protein